MVRFKQSSVLVCVIMETLRGDLKKILVGSAELLSRAGSLQAPSWKFPEKLAISLDVEGALKEGLKQDEPRFFIQELVIDRLLLVLQCCVFELEGVRGHRLPNVPLTLGSTVKRLSKCILQNASHISDLKEQLSAKTQQISSLESSFSELQHEYQLLQNNLHSSTDTSVTTVTEHKDGANSQEMSLISESFMSKIFHPISPKLTDVYTQTTDTAFALCAQCSATQLGLVRSAQLVTGLCEKHNFKSKFSSYDWVALEKVGGLEIADWCEAIRIDMEALDESSCSLLERVEMLSLERDELNERAHHLQIKSRALDGQLNTLKDANAHNESVLSKSKKEFAANLASLESVQSQLKLRNSAMKKELNTSQQQVKNLSTSMAQFKIHRSRLETDLHAMEKREQELKAAKQNLEDQLDSVIRQSQEALNDSQVEINKYKMHSETLEKKHKLMKSKQSALLSQLDALDEECGSLREELVQVENSRQKLARDLQQVQTQYKHVQKQLNNEQDKLSEANQEQDRLNTRLTTLETQLTNTKDQVEIERRNCRLLMDYPFIKQTGENYGGHVASIIQSQQSRRQITANTIRILLLEEQNSELRHKVIGEVKERKSEESDISKVDFPLRLWEDELVSEIEDQQEAIRKSAQSRGTNKLSSHQGQSWQHPNPQLPGHADVELPGHTFIRKSRSTGSSSAPTASRLGERRSPHSMKGRLGHLVAAVAEAHKHTTAQPRQPCVDGKNSADIEVYLCDTCDRMFYLAEEMQKHSLSCERLS